MTAAEGGPALAAARAGGVGLDGSRVGSRGAVRSKATRLRTVLGLAGDGDVAAAA